MGAPGLRRLGADEWPILRELRLAALRDSPEAFASTLERELSFDEQTWRSRCETSCYLLAEIDRRPVGMAAVIVLAGDPPAVSPFDTPVPEGAELHLVSMWVDPLSRGRGISRLLIEGLATAAAERGGTALFLWVVGTNDAAVRAYEKAGFTRTGDRAPLPHSPEVTEEKMRLELR